MEKRDATKNTKLRPKQSKTKTNTTVKDDDGNKRKEKIDRKIMKKSEKKK